VLFIHWPNKTFLVPDSCRATIRNGKNLTTDVTDDAKKTIRTTLVSAIFRHCRCYVYVINLMYLFYLCRIFVVHKYKDNNDNNENKLLK
jgi:hypothetical protein